MLQVDEGDGAKVYWDSCVSIDPPKVEHDTCLRRKTQSNGTWTHGSYFCLAQAAFLALVN